MRAHEVSYFGTFGGKVRYGFEKELLDDSLRINRDAHGKAVERAHKLFHSNWPQFPPNQIFVDLGNNSYHMNGWNINYPIAFRELSHRVMIDPMHILDIRRFAYVSEGSGANSRYMSAFYLFGPSQSHAPQSSGKDVLQFVRNAMTESRTDPGITFAFTNPKGEILFDGRMPNRPFDFRRLGIISDKYAITMVSSTRRNFTGRPLTLGTLNEGLANLGDLEQKYPLNVTNEQLKFPFVELK